MIHFIDIDPDNWRLGLKVAEAQKRYIADSAGILARAYAYRDFRSHAFLICKDDTPIGMGLYYDCPEFDCYDFSQFFIDERYQTRVRKSRYKADGKYNKVILCYIEGNLAAKRNQS